MTKEKLIDQIMKECAKDGESVTKEEAEEMAEMEIRSNAMRRYEKSDAPRKLRKPREKKENPLKKQIISGIHDYFLDEIGHIFPKNTTITVRNNEKYIDLCIDGMEFTINLIQHRTKSQNAP